MEIRVGTTYPTNNGGTVRIIANDRVSLHGKYWVGLYTPETLATCVNSEWIVTYNELGGAFVFDTPKPELSITPFVRRWWVISFLDYTGALKAEIFNAQVNTRENIENRIKRFAIVKPIVTLVEQNGS